MKRRWVLAGVMTAAALAGCSEPDPKAECVRYRVELKQLEGRWSADPPMGMTYEQESEYRDMFEAKHPNYVADRNKLKQQFGRSLRTSDIDLFCRSYR